eukprot:RCo049238
MATFVSRSISLDDDEDEEDGEHPLCPPPADAVVQLVKQPKKRVLNLSLLEPALSTVTPVPCGESVAQEPETAAPASSTPTVTSPLSVVSVASSSVPSEGAPGRRKKKRKRGAAEPPSPATGAPTGTGEASSESQTAAELVGEEEVEGEEGQSRPKKVRGGGSSGAAAVVNVADDAEEEAVVRTAMVSLVAAEPTFEDWEGSSSSEEEHEERGLSSTVASKVIPESLKFDDQGRSLSGLGFEYRTFAKQAELEEATRLLPGQTRLMCHVHKKWRMIRYLMKQPDGFFRCLPNNLCTDLNSPAGKDFRGGKPKERRESRYYCPNYCANCGAAGHYSRECPLPRRDFLKACVVCGRSDHLYDQCPSRLALPSTDAVRTGLMADAPRRPEELRHVTCFICLKTGHFDCSVPAREPTHSAGPGKCPRCIQAHPLSACPEVEA